MTLEVGDTYVQNGTRHRWSNTGGGAGGARGHARRRQPRQRRSLRALVRRIIGMVLVVVGGVWIAQGTGALGGSFMTGEGFWTFIGVICVLLGIASADRNCAATWAHARLRRTGRTERERSCRLLVERARIPDRDGLSDGSSALVVEAMAAGRPSTSCARSSRRPVPTSWTSAINRRAQQGGDRFPPRTIVIRAPWCGSRSSTGRTSTSERCVASRR